MGWIRAENVCLERKTVDGRSSMTARVSGLSLVEGGRLPSGEAINPELADKNSGLRKKLRGLWGENSPQGWNQDVGPMRVNNGGGAYSLSPNLVGFLDGDADLLPKISEKLGASPTLVVPVVSRDFGAPGTCGVFDGGGAGRGECLFSSPEEFLVKQCLAECLGEVGLVHRRPMGVTGRVSFTLPEPLKAHEGWLEEHIIVEWHKAHGEVPCTSMQMQVSICEQPDTLDVEGMGTLENVLLAIEWGSASLECLARIELGGQMSSGHLLFKDLESRDGQALNRVIGAVLVADGGPRSVACFRDGSFDIRAPLYPVVTGSDVALYGNEKFQAVLRMFTS